MKVHRCTKCQKRGGYLVFRQTKKNVKWKYPYIGHYDPIKKSRRQWCSLNENQLNTIEFVDDWYQIDYGKLIEKAQYEHRKHGENKISEDALVQAGELLEKNGFLKYRIADKIFYNLTHIFVTEKFIEDTIGDEYTDKPKN